MTEDREHTSDRDKSSDDGQKPVKRQEPSTEPSEEWGERLDQGKAVARGGKTSGHVPGAQPDKGGTN